VASDSTLPIVETSCQFAPPSLVRRSTLPPHHQPSLWELKERLEGFTTTSEGPGGSRRASHVWPPFVVRSNNAEVPLALAPVTNANPSLLLGKVSDVTDQWPMKLIELADAEN
jgi:hypothetical protein